MSSGATFSMPQPTISPGGSSQFNLRFLATSYHVDKNKALLDGP